MSITAKGFCGTCDACGTELQVPALNVASAQKLLALHGWELADLDLCRHCKEGRNAGAAGTLLLIIQAKERKAAHG